MGLKDKLKIGWRHILLTLGCGVVGTAYFLSPSELEKNPLFVYEKPHKPGDRLCFTGDVGENNEGQRKVAELLGKNCDRVFVLGDLIYPIGIKSPEDPRLQTHFIQHYEKLGIPFHLVLGNHGYYSKVDPIKNWQRVSSKFNTWIHFPNAFYVLKLGHQCFFAIDSTPITSAKATIRFQTQEEWLTKAIDTPGCRKKYLLSHHPWKSPGRHGDAKGRMKKFFDHFEKHFDLMIAGHDHLLAKDGKSIVTGAGAKLRKKLSRENVDYLSINLGIFVLHKGESKFLLVEQ